MSAAMEGAASGLGNAALAGGKKLGNCVSCLCGIFSNQVKKLSPRTVGFLLRLLNIANAVLLGAASYFAYTIASGATLFFLATYIGAFALILFLFETRVKYTEMFIRRLFGFMFTGMGRAVFLIFLGAICFGVLDSSSSGTAGYNWCLGVGIGTVVNALFNCFIICSHPGYQKANRNPDWEDTSVTAGDDPARMTDEQIKAYLNAHPEVAARAAASLQNTQPQPAAAPTGAAVFATQQGWGASAVAAPAPPSAAASSSAAGKKSFFGGRSGGGKSGGKGDSGAYTPPSFTGDVEAPVSISPPVSAAVPPASARSAPSPAARSTQPVAPADADNPFASTANPFG